MSLRYQFQWANRGHARTPSTDRVCRCAAVVCGHADDPSTTTLSSKVNTPRYSLSPRTPMTAGCTTPSSAPGPGSYFRAGHDGAYGGGAYSEVNRFGNRSLASQLRAWAKSVGRHATSEQRIDWAHRY